MIEKLGRLTKHELEDFILFLETENLVPNENNLHYWAVNFKDLGQPNKLPG